jgi:membrane protease YdiL (CAAX protease family)
MPRCESCGAFVRAGGKFCPKCGTALDPDAVLPPLQRTPEPAPAEPAAPPRRRSRGAAAETGRLWGLFVSVLWFFLLLLAVSGVSAMVSNVQDTTSPWIDVFATVAGAIIVLAFVAVEWEVIAPALKTFGLRGARLLLPVAILAGLWVFVAVWFAALEALGVETLEYLADFREHGWPLWTAIVLLCVCPPVFEELGFRGFVQGRLERIVSPWEAILIQAALFSVVHLLPLIFVTHFVLGIAFGWLRRVSGSLYPGMILHAAWNALVLLEEF